MTFKIKYERKGGPLEEIPDFIAFKKDGYQDHDRFIHVVKGQGVDTFAVYRGRFDKNNNPIMEHPMLYHSNGGIINLKLVYRQLFDEELKDHFIDYNYSSQPDYLFFDNTIAQSASYVKSRLSPEKTKEEIIEETMKGNEESLKKAKSVKNMFLKMLGTK